MAGKPANVYLTSAATVALSERATGNRSAAVSRMIERYAEMCKRSLPELTEDEWGILYTACSYWYIDSTPSIRYLPMEVQDYLADVGIDAPGLVAKLQALSYPEMVAVLDATERHWSKGEKW